MNLDLYTDEFRNFKFLKSDARAVKYFREASVILQKVQPWTCINDPDFVWETRLEFLEQLFDLKNDTVYLVVPPDVNPLGFTYEDSRLYTIVKPFIYKGKAFQVENLATLEDIPNMEENPAGFYISSQEYSFDDKIFLTMEGCPLIPNDFENYSVMFYDREWAQKYKDAITFFLKRNHDAMTAITRSF